MRSDREPTVVTSVREAQIPQLQSASGEAGLCIRLLGPIAVTWDGQTIVISSKKVRALLGYLAMREGTEVSRSLLTGLLWGDRSEGQARASLRQALSELRAALSVSEVPAIAASKETVTWTTGSAWIDANVLPAAAKSTDDDVLRSAAELIGGELMEGLSLEERGFQDWLQTEREQIRLLACAIYARLMEQGEQRGRLEEALAGGLKLLSLDPLQEHVHRALMRIYAAQGRYDAALAQYERCRRELSNQLGVAPDPETEELLRSVRKNRRAPTARKHHALSEPGAANRPWKQPELPDRPSIAVLPFTPIGADQESGYFAEGIADDIITELSRNKELFVVARHSSFSAAHEIDDYQGIGRALGVRHILTGSVRRASDRLRLSVHFVACETGNEVWAERYDRKLEDLFQVQLDVARTVTATIAGRLTALADAVSAAKPPDSFDAYDHVLRAQHYLQLYTQADYASARSHLKKAIAADPGYARAYGLLCIASLYEWWFWEMREDGLADVLAIGEKALALDSHDAKAHLALGVAQLLSHHHDRAVYHFDRAIALNPNDDLAVAEHGRLLMYLDQPEEGLLRVREAMRLNPYHPNWYWNLEGRCLHTAARYDEAIAAFGRIDAPQFWTEAYLAACHAMCGHHERARHHIDRLYELRPDFQLSTFEKALPYRSKETLERFLETFRQAGIRE